MSGLAIVPPSTSGGGASVCVFRAQSAPVVSIIDEHTRECLLVDRSVTADVLIYELDRLATTRGYPAVLRCDNGPELACQAMVDWAGDSDDHHRRRHSSLGYQAPAI